MNAQRIINTCIVNTPSKPQISHMHVFRGLGSNLVDWPKEFLTLWTHDTKTMMSSHLHVLNKMVFYFFVGFIPCWFVLFCFRFSICSCPKTNRQTKIINSHELNLHQSIGWMYLFNPFPLYRSYIGLSKTVKIV